VSAPAASPPTVIAVADADAAADAAVRLVVAALPAGSGAAAPADPAVAPPTGAADEPGATALTGPPGTVEGVPGTASAVARGDDHVDEADARTAIALAGGRTPLETFRRLGAQPIAWDRVDVFLADERCVAYDHPDSNARAIDEALGRRGYALHRLAETGSPGDRAHAYAHELDERPLALVLLGMGEDGHVASLFPRHGGLDANGTTVAILDSPKPPPERVSLTLPRIAAAERIVLLVTGAGKAEALRRALAEPSPDAPASLLPHDRLTVVADADALRAARDAGLVPVD
jgi:6-phosphogluconolactonase